MIQDQGPDHKHHIVESFLNELHENFDYPREITYFDRENLDFMPNELNSCLFIWDIQYGTILVLKEGDLIDQAYVGFTRVADKEL
jgi:hypothetical protein